MKIRIRLICVQICSNSFGLTRVINFQLISNKRYWKLVSDWFGYRIWIGLEWFEMNFYLKLSLWRFSMFVDMIVIKLRYTTFIFFILMATDQPDHVTRFLLYRNFSLNNLISMQNKIPSLIYILFLNNETCRSLPILLCPTKKNR